MFPRKPAGRTAGSVTRRAGHPFPNRCTLLAAVNSPEAVHGNVNRPAFQAVSGNFQNSFHG
ncbi:hypothetical protein SAMN06295987_104308 [Novosphingobium mathurense]|uniref:Uncharacterized protein n=1 Tax=Novosphingobium mathurense TaxID=428990 RepID=A0A1U6I7D7_9SPHN|nr:hypothetical protein SAMN06295987_104308 [Novosphingobium mathurense]